MVLETHVGGSDSSVYGGLQGMHLEVESNLNKSGGMEALRERKVCAATVIVSMPAAGGLAHAHPFSRRKVSARAPFWRTRERCPQSAAQ